jgi:triose/dihydroxyacetone kinase / FAD-AMP lyase (cyclizing)
MLCLGLLYAYTGGKLKGWGKPPGKWTDFVHADQQVKVERLLMGQYMTALDMVGISISIMRVTDTDLVQWLDAPTDAAAWPKQMLQPAASPQRVPLHADVLASLSESTAAAMSASPLITSVHTERVRTVLKACAQACIKAEPMLTDFDKKVSLQMQLAFGVFGLLISQSSSWTCWMCDCKLMKPWSVHCAQAGDGDCGVTIRSGAEALLAALPGLQLMDLSGACDRVSKILLHSMGGTSGALYFIFFAAAAQAFDGLDAEIAGPAEFAQALQQGCEAVCRHGGASVGDRSMVDALELAAHAAATNVAGASPCPPCRCTDVTHCNTERSWRT